MSGGTSGSASDSKSRTQIDPTQVKYLRKGWNAAKMEILRQPLDYYSGQTVSDFDPAMIEAHNLALERGRAGNATMNAGEAYTQDVLGGKYLSPESNPYLRDTYDLAARGVTENYRDSVLPLLESRFGASGQSRSAGYMGARTRADQALGRSLGDLATTIYGGAYENERGRMESARAAGQMYADEDFRNLNAIGDVGAQRQAQAQRYLDDLLARFNFQRDEPFLRIGRYAGIIGGPTVTGTSKNESASASVWGGLGASGGGG